MIAIRPAIGSSTLWRLSFDRDERCSIASDSLSSISPPVQDRPVTCQPGSFMRYGKARIICRTPHQ